jgi:uncharacterized membrane protein YjjP (DUF1212 family)
VTRERRAKWRFKDWASSLGFQHYNARFQSPQPSFKTLTPEQENDRYQQAIAFVAKLGGALQRYGTPANRLDQVLVFLSKELGLKGNFFSTPSAIFYSYDLPGERGFARLQRVYNKDLDLSKLSQLDRLFNDVWAGTVSLVDGAKRVDEITADPPPYKKWLTFLCFGLTSAMASTFFGGGFAEMLLSGATGSVLGLLYLWAAANETIGRLFEPLGALLVSITALSLAGTLGASSDIATLAGIIVLVPGFSIAIGATELALGHPASGVARLAGAMVTFLMLTMGVMFGQQITSFWGVDAAADFTPAALPGWVEPMALLVAGTTLGILFKAARRDLPWTVAAVMLPYLAFQLGIADLGLEASIFLGALIAGVFSNVFARWKDRPSLIVRLPGILILVPGATGFLSLGDLANGDVLEGMQAMVRVLMTATALVTGFLVSNAVLPPRKAL